MTIFENVIMANVLTAHRNSSNLHVQLPSDLLRLDLGMNSQRLSSFMYANSRAVGIGGGTGGPCPPPPIICTNMPPPPPKKKKKKKKKNLKNYVCPPPNL